MQTRTRQQWAKHLEQVWTQVTYEAVERFFRLGRDIIQSKEELPHGEFIQMLKEVGMNRNTANSFMRIARCEMMDNVHHLLPPDWGTIVKLTRLDPAVFTRLVDDGALSPNVSRNEISRILRLQRVGEDERRVLNLKPLKGKFRTIILDPAWKYDDSIVGRAKPDYALQKIEQLQALDVRAWADEKAGCHLYLWSDERLSARGHTPHLALGFHVPHCHHLDEALPRTGSLLPQQHGARPLRHARRHRHAPGRCEHPNTLRGTPRRAQ
jgi:hypothetical protein